MEEVAERLGLPLTVLMGRVVAGDIPSRREDSFEGVRYWLRLDDLGLDAWDRSGDADEADSDPGAAPVAEELTAGREPVAGGLKADTEPGAGDLNTGAEPAAGVDEAAAAKRGADSTAAEPAGDLGSARASRVDSDDGVAHVGEAIQSSFNPGEPSRLADDASWSLDGGLPSQWPGMETPGGEVAPALEAPNGDAADSSAEGEASRSEARAASPGTPAEPAAPPYEPPDWLRMPPDRDTTATLPREEDERSTLSNRESSLERHAVPFPEGTQAPPVGTPLEAVADLPVPQATPRVDLFEPSSPRGDLAAMSLDARELVAGLLDRWERTLEQRIYAEQRQRFESELMARQTAVKQLQMELHTARAEHAAAQAEKDRMLAEKERELADREREIAESRLATDPSGRRRHWFRRADD